MDSEEFRSLVEELRRTPARLRELMAGLPPEKEVHKPGPDAFSVRENYNGRPSGPALEEFALLRAANVERLQRLAPEDLDRAGTWEKVGPVTLGNVLEMWRDHDRGHLDEIAWLAGRLPAEPKHDG